MKQLLSTLLILTLVLGVFTVPAYAKDTDSFEAEGFSCRILDDGTVSITDCSITRPQVSIPETLNGYSVSTLGENAFFSIRNTLTEVSIPSGVTTVGWNAFSECAELRRVVLPESVARVEGSAFEGCTALESVVLPEGLSEIAPSVFYGCSALREITIPAAVTVIRTAAFLGCESLTGITIPDKVVEIESKAFMNCHALADVKLGKSLTEVAHEAFYGCENLKQIYIPANVTLIGYRAFGFWTKGSSSGESGLYITIDNTELLIRGEKGSAAEEYAEQSGLPFKEGETESNDDPGTADRPEPVDEIAMLSGMPVKVNTTWELPCVLRAPGLPAVIEGRLDYDVEGVELVTGHSDYPENGMRFELYPELYDCEYTAQPGRVTFRYTLKTGKTADDYFDARDAKEGSAQSRDLNTLQSFPLAFAAIRVIASGEYNASFSLINVVNTDGNVLYRDGEKMLGIPYGFQRIMFPRPDQSLTVVRLGDTDLDNKVTILDATAIQRHLAKLPTDSYAELQADADQDKKITVLDATAIQRWLAKLPTNPNIGEMVNHYF